MKFQIGQGTRNALLDGNVAPAAFRQSLLEHKEALERFVKPGMNPAQKRIALEQGKLYEESLPKYWNDNTPRRPLHPSSSFIEQVETYPGLGMTRIQIGDKSYIYPMSTDEVGRMITSDSIGQYYNNHVKVGDIED